MASSAEMQRRAREKRRGLTSLLHPARLLPNTASWVDEAYGQRLCKQLYTDIEEHGLNARKRLLAGADDNYSIAALRKFPGFVHEERTAGRASAVSLLATLDASQLDETSIPLSFASWLLKGEKMDSSKCCVHGFVSKHAIARLFERQRTNARHDTFTALTYIIGIEQPICEGQTAEVVTPDGTLYLTAIRLKMKNGDLLGVKWLVKTFIGDKK